MTFDQLKPNKILCGPTHVFNSWDAMPPVSEQMTMPGSRTNPDLVAARFLLKQDANMRTP